MHWLPCQTPSYWSSGDAESVRRELVKGDYFDVRQGFVYPSSKPGLGINVNEEAFGKYPYKKLHLEYFGDEYNYHGDNAVSKSYQ
jgi:galactonate dehydratase